MEIRWGTTLWSISLLEYPSGTKLLCFLLNYLPRDALPLCITMGPRPVLSPRSSWRLGWRRRQRRGLAAAEKVYMANSITIYWIWIKTRWYHLLSLDRSLFKSRFFKNHQNTGFLGVTILDFFYFFFMWST